MSKIAENRSLIQDLIAPHPGPVATEVSATSISFERQAYSAKYLARTLYLAALSFVETMRAIRNDGMLWALRIGQPPPQVEH